MLPIQDRLSTAGLDPLPAIAAWGTYDRLGAAAERNFDDYEADGSGGIRKI